MYCGHMGVECPENWNFYLAFVFFRLAVMLQGRHRGSLAGEEPSQASCALHRHSHGHRAFLSWEKELSRGQSWEPRAVSYRWSSQTFQLSTSFCQGTHREVERTLSAVCLHASGVALQPLSELNLMLFSHPVERNFPESCWAGCLGCDYVTQTLLNQCPVLLSPGRPAPGDSSPKDAEFVAELAWDFAIKEGFRVFEKLPPTKLLARHCSTWAGRGPFLSRSYSTWARPGAAPVPTAPCWGWPRVFAARWKIWASSGAFHSRATPCPLPELQVGHLC